MTAVLKTKQARLRAVENDVLLDSLCKSAPLMIEEISKLPEDDAADAYENLLGMVAVCIQKHCARTASRAIDMKKCKDYYLRSLGPKTHSKYSDIELIHHAANYWKHESEWQIINAINHSPDGEWKPNPDWETAMKGKESSSIKPFSIWNEGTKTRKVFNALSETSVGSSGNIRTIFEMIFGCVPTTEADFQELRSRVSLWSEAVRKEVY